MHVIVYFTCLEQFDDTTLTKGEGMEEFSRPESEFEAHWLHLYYNYCELTASLGVKLAHNEKYHSLTSYVKHLCKIQISLSPRSLVIYHS